MSKSIKKALSLLLALTMVLSLGLPAYAVGAPEDDIAISEEPAVKTANLPIGAGKQPGVIEEDEIISEDLIVDIVDEETVVEEEAAPAKDFSYSESATGFSVEVSAPAGALPLGTEMVVDRLVDLSAVQSAVDSADNLDGEVQLAADISFWLNGQEIEPAEGAKLVVRMSAPEIEAIAAPIVIHIPDGENAVPEIMEQLGSGDIAMADSVSFETGSFSVYAIIGGETDEEARAAVEFYGLEDALVATYYVKNSDVLLGDGERDHEKSYIEDIITDPGIGGQVPDGQIFVGWYIGESKDYTVDTKPLTIDGVRKYVSEQTGTFTEGTSKIKVYAMLFRVYTITYLDEQNISIGSDELYSLPSVTSVDYQVSKTYNPVDPTKNFEGWITDNDSAISNAKYEGENRDEPYPMDTTMTISGNIVFTVQAPKGHWLVFYENGKGATYIAPQFVKGDDVTVEPDADMLRLGYTFGGWYTVKYDDDAEVDESKKFEFGHKLEESPTNVYAYWTTNETAKYVVIFWKQNVDGENWDFASSQTVSNGRVGNEIVVTPTDTQVAVTGVTTYTIPTGFSFDHADEGLTVAADGSTVVNIYIKRNTYTLTFKSTDSNFNIEYKTISGYELVHVQQGNNNYYAIKIDGKWYRLSRSANNNYNWGHYVWDTVEITSVPSPGQGYITYRYGNSYDSDVWLNGTEYTIPTDDSIVKTITALYGQSIADEFPISDAYPTGTRWMPQSSFSAVIDGENITFFTVDVVVAYIDAMPPTNMTLVYNARSVGGDYQRRTMNYWWEAPEGTIDNPSDPKTTTYKGKVYEKHQTVVAVYRGVTIEDYIDFVGFERFEADKSRNSDGYYVNSNNTRATEVNFYYTRKVYPITFFDGLYFNGDNVAFSVNDYNPLGQLKVVNNVVYGSDVSGYNKNGSTFYEPTTEYPGFVFEGWYIDDACTEPYNFTTMPEGGIKVYAKWRQIQYRVFLHPNAKLPDGTNDNSLDWGDSEKPEDEKQAMNFRISYQGKLSIPTGLRDQYEFIGWFTDAAMTKPFNEDTQLTEDTVKTDYDKTASENYTDPMDKFGEGATWNSDVQDKNGNPRDRFWITKKLDLYGKWSAILTGAQGIGVIYDVNGGSDAPSDTRKYKDNVDALARPACTPPVGERFLYWVVQKWNGTEYEDTATIVYPGAKFTVLKSLAKETDLTPDAADYVEGEVYKAYTMQLRAEYGPGESSKNTFIHWYQNDKDPSERLHEDKDLMINEGVDIYTLTEGIPTRFGYTFLGWARLSEHEQFDDATGDATDEAITYHDVTASDLYLKWIVDNEETGAGHYEAQKSDDSWVTVTQVAADEAKPYQAFYAVWDAEYFYVYHTGTATNNVEKHKLDEAENDKGEVVGFNLTQNIPDGKLYGGYYSEYAGVPADFDATALTYDENGKATVSGTVYDGKNVTFDGSKAYTRDENGKTGLNMIPEAGKVYYVKEVPADSYLKQMFKFTYNTTGGKIGSAWLITNADDENYGDIGFDIYDTAKKLKPLAGEKAKTLSITALNTNNTKVFKVSNEVTDKADKALFTAGKLMSYKLVYVNMSALKEGIEYENELVGGNLIDANYQVVNYWLTPDGLKVTGTTNRTYKQVLNAYSSDTPTTETVVSVIIDPKAA